MAIDEGMLQALAQGQGQPTLRFYQWQPACLSLGFAQSTREIDEAALAAQGYTWVRRPTGGRSILHIDELTYSLVVPETDPRVTGGIIPAYRNLSRGLLRGLQQLDIPAIQAQGDMPKNPTQGFACFDTPSHYEVTAHGKKLIGSAQLRRKGIVLQHGSLPLHGNLGRIFQFLRLSDTDRAAGQADLEAHAITLAAATQRNIPFLTVAKALQAGFAETLNLTWDEAGLTSFEQSLVQTYRHDIYTHDAWNRRR